MKIVVAFLVLISIGAASAQSSYENVKIRNTCKVLSQCDSGPAPVKTTSPKKK